jgi:hypothetical protein
MLTSGYKILMSTYVRYVRTTRKHKSILDNIYTYSHVTAKREPNRPNAFGRFGSSLVKYPNRSGRSAFGRKGRKLNWTELPHVYSYRSSITDKVFVVVRINTHIHSEYHICGCEYSFPISIIASWVLSTFNTLPWLGWGAKPPCRFRTVTNQMFWTYVRNCSNALKAIWPWLYSSTAVPKALGIWFTINTVLKSIA